jgi:hypothetical protein
MRPLNRPMFRNGGPLREGIMSGMQDRPGYKKGSLIAGLVSKIPGGQAAIDYGRGIIPRIFNRIKPTFKTQPGVVTGGTKGGTVRSDALGLANYKRNIMSPVPFSQRAKAFVKENPYFTGAAAPFAVSTGAAVIPPVLEGGGKLLKSAALQVADLAVPDFIFDQDKFLENKKIAELNKNIKETKKTTAVQEKDKVTTTTPKISRDEEIEANRKRYYKLMGIDNMKKDAAYNSLIDASNIIQKEGADLKGSIKSGSLQSQIINAISGNLDESANLKKQIDAAILKGEITKDINKDKDALTKELTKKRIELADKQLAGGTLNETLSELRTKQGIVPEGPELAALAIQKDIDIPAGHTFNTKDVNTFLKDNPTLNVVDFVNDQNLKLQQAGKGNLDPGNYVVGKNIVVVGEDGTVTDVIS